MVKRNLVVESSDEEEILSSDNVTDKPTAVVINNKNNNGDVAAGLVAIVQSLHSAVNRSNFSDAVAILESLESMPIAKSDLQVTKIGRSVFIVQTCLRSL
jgi:hypothetical protein